MELNVESLVIGVLVGVVGAFWVWIIFSTISNNRKRNREEECDIIISSIGDALVEIDKLVSSHNSGIISLGTFKRDLSDKLSKLNKKFKPYLHLLDVYYIKYIDKLLGDYADILLQSDIASRYDQEEVVESSQTEFPEPQKPEETDFPLTNIIKESKPPVVGNDSRRTAKKVKKQNKKDNRKEAKVRSFESPPVVAPVSIESPKVLPVDDSDMAEILEKRASKFAQDELEHEAQQIALAAIPEDQVADMSFEEMAKDVLTDDAQNAEPTNGFSAIAPPKTPRDAHTLPPQNHFDGSNDQDFSKETLMDIDVHKVRKLVDDASNIYKNEDYNEPETFETVANAAIDQVEVQSKDVKTRKIPPVGIETPNAFNKYMPLKTTASSQEEDAVFERKPTKNEKDSQKNTNATSNKDEKDTVAITGDDVADQIDSFFGIGK